MNLHIPNNDATEQLNMFPKSIQKKINWFGFFLAFPFLSIGGNSITFFIFISLVLATGKFWKASFRGKYLFLGFLFIGLLSTICTPIYARHENFGTIITFIQFTYWIYMSIFFILMRNRIDMIQVSKWIMYGVFGYTIAFYFIPFDIKNPLFSFEFNPGRNAYVFNMLCCIPLTFIYLINKYSKSKVLLFIILFALILLSTNGRSGSIIILIQVVLILSVVYPSIQRAGKKVIILFFFLFLIVQNSEVETYLNYTASKVESINPRLASLMRGEGEGDLTQDKSWLTRKLMIEKGFEIVEKHPFIGVGPSNFRHFEAELKSYVNYKRLQSIPKKVFDSRTSAHNTYIQAISEFGIIGFILYLLILFLPILFFIKKFLKIQLNSSHFILICFIGMVIHFYTVANLTGALPWFIIGLSWSFIQRNKTQTN